MANKGNGSPNLRSLDTPPEVHMHDQYVREISFENLAARKRIEFDRQAKFDVQFHLDATKNKDPKRYEVGMKVSIKATDKDTHTLLFQLIVDYVGVFSVKSVFKEQLQPIILVECPRLLFPYVRRVVHDIVRDGGYPPLNLEIFDFNRLYQQAMEAGTIKY